MRVTLVVLFVSGWLLATACATASRAASVPGIVVEVVDAPADLGPLSIWISPVYQRSGRVRLGDVLPGGRASFTYDAPSVGTYLLQATPQLQGRDGLTAQLDILSDTERVVWDLRTNHVRQGR